tara:strand:+ start:408 stop:920 length:513 start_codon:yes stop_codon:yes gene_type:complete
MNIFYLDINPTTSAQMLCDKHIPKMLLESCQMLSTAIRELQGDDEHLYKKAHPKHPSTLWVQESPQNFKWLYDHAMSIAKEYTKRYGKIHKSSRILKYIQRKYCFKLQVDSQYHTAPPQCMPDEYKKDVQAGGQYQSRNAYRQFYIGEKSRFAKWEKGTPIPNFMKGASE